MKKFFIILVSISILTSWWAFMPDQGEEANAKPKVIYIYNFTKYIEWPADKKSGNFVVGVLGSNNAIMDELNKMASTKTVVTQKIEIKAITTAAEAANCQIVYILPDNSGQLTEVVNKVKSSSTLIVTEKPGLSKLGAGINFVVIDSKLKFELNKPSLENHNLKVASQLESLAVH